MGLVHICQLLTQMLHDCLLGCLDAAPAKPCIYHHMDVVKIHHSVQCVSTDSSVTDCKTTPYITTQLSSRLPKTHISVTATARQDGTTAKQKLVACVIIICRIRTPRQASKVPPIWCCPPRLLLGACPSSNSQQLTAHCCRQSVHAGTC